VNVLGTNAAAAANDACTGGGPTLCPHAVGVRVEIGANFGDRGVRIIVALLGWEGICIDVRGSGLVEISMAWLSWLSIQTSCRKATFRSRRRSHAALRSR
jgi:hypothetical protein